MGGGELADGVSNSILSGLSPMLLPAAVSVSLGFWSLLSCIETSLAEPSETPLLKDDLSWPFQLGTSQATPVKLLT